MLRLTSATLLVILILPLATRAQTWSEEEQSAIDHILGCWDHNEDFDKWTRDCNPADDMTYWWTSEPAPSEGTEYMHKVARAWWKRYENIGNDLRPYRVKLYGDVAALYFYGIGQDEDADGEVTNFVSYRLELLRKVDDRWQLIGGMGVPLSQ